MSRFLGDDMQLGEGSPITKEISISKGYKVLIDEADFDLVSKYRWYALEKSHTTYAITDSWKNGEKQSFRMHRLIMNAPKNMEVDHVNGNGLDNRRANLRICTRQQNALNRKPHPDNTSGITGIYWDKKSDKWRAKINISGKSIHLGFYDDKDAAIRARKNAEKEVYGEYAHV